MKRLLFLIATTLMLSCEQSNTPTVSLKWEMGCNAESGASHTNQFTIYNQGTVALDSNWVIYYSELPRHITQDLRESVRIEVVMSDYYRMYPSASYQPIAPGDSLVVAFACSWPLIKGSHGPHGAFIVFTNDGEELPPMDISLVQAPINKSCQLDTPAEMFPYPYGDVVYRDNELVLSATTDRTDLFPSVKQVTKTGGDLTISEVWIVADEAFKSEAEMLSANLTTHNKMGVREGASVNIRLTRLPADTKPANSEYYQLHVGDKEITIAGGNAHAVFNGTQTLLALLRGQTAPTRLPMMTIVDYPDLEYRGQMIDVARNFIKKENLMKLLDLFATYKLNTLHLHATDDEGWRIEIPGLEELTEVGARRGYCPDESLCLNPAYGSGHSYTDPTSAGNGYYTKADFIEILQYAAKRHITVIPEIDFPGHGRAAIVSMKARYNKYKASDKAKAEEYLLSDQADTSRYFTAQLFTDNVLCVAMESTYRFIDKVVAELTQTYTDAGLKLTTLHIGGDEVPLGAWSGSQLCRDLMQRESISDVHDLNPYFFNRIVQILDQHNIPVSGWQELGTYPNASINKKLIGKSKYLYCWNTTAETGVDQVPYDLANAGYEIVLSNVTNLYFDLAYSRHQDERGLYWGGFNNEVTAFDMLPYSVYRSVRRDLKGSEIDIFNTSKQKRGLSADAKINIKGIQGQLFHESLLTFDQTTYALFPKIFGLVERGWNATPAWSLTNNKELEQKLYRADLSLYYAKIFERELPWLLSQGVHVRINPPGFKIIDGTLHMNNVNPAAENRYTLDGTEPTQNSSLWSNPVEVSMPVNVKAKAFLGDKQSVTILMQAAK